MPERRVRLRSAAAAIAALFLAPAAAAQAPDYRAELPRVPPRGPAASLAALRPLPGFEVRLVASEPLIADPVAAAFDERARLYVVCMRDYSEQAEERLGELRLLDDADGDGVYERGTLFARGLSWPTAVACWRGGVFVGAAPDIHYFKDEDGDGVAERRELVFTGFSRANVQGLLNSFVWGLDNRIHGSASSSGGDVRRAGSEAEPLSLRGRDFAFDPRTLEISAESGGAQHGLSFDDWGRKLVCSNSSHVELVMFEDRYARRQPHLAAPPARKLIAADGGQAAVFRSSPVEPWRILRTRLRVAGQAPGPIEGGGRAAGYFTSATGITIGRGDAWPPELRGLAYVGDVGSNIVHRKRLEPDGIGLTARRIDEGCELLASEEIWFRPVQFANAPDGALLILDMYREVIEHPLSLPPQIKPHIDLTSGRDLGRIWRLAPSGAPARPPPRLDRASTAELAALLSHPNAWQRETAARLIYERRDPAAAAPLRALAATGEEALGRLHALYALAGLGALDASTLLASLADAHPRVREHAVRLSEAAAGASEPLRRRLAALAEDGDARVRYQLAFTLGEVGGPERLAGLLALARRDAGDPWMRFAIASSLFGQEADLVAALLADPATRRGDGSRMLLAELAGLLARGGSESDAERALAAIAALADADADLSRALLSAILAGLRARGSPLAARFLDAGSEAGAVWSAILDRARAQALDRRLEAPARIEAVRTLALSERESERRSLAALLDGLEPAEVQLAALDALGRSAGGGAGALVIAAWPGLGPRAREAAAELLIRRPAWLAAALDAIEAGTLRVFDLGRPRLEAFERHPDPSLRSRVAAALAADGLGARPEVAARYAAALTLEGHPERGKAAFLKSCASCHRVESRAFGAIGVEIGPNLLAFRDRGPEAYLLSVLDPNREVQPQYQTYLVLSRDGRAATGLIAAESAASITLRRAGGEGETVLRSEILSLSGTGQSLMPEGLENELDPQAMADLLAWIYQLR